MSNPLRNGRQAGSARVADPGPTDVAVVRVSGAVGRAGSGVLHGHMAIKIADERLGLGLSALDLRLRRIHELAEVPAERPLQRETPGREVVPARTAGGLRIRCDDLQTVREKIGPIVDVLGIAFAN